MKLEPVCAERITSEMEDITTSLREQLDKNAVLVDRLGRIIFHLQPDYPEGPYLDENTLSDILYNTQSRLFYTNDKLESIVNELEHLLGNIKLK